MFIENALPCEPLFSSTDLPAGKHVCSEIRAPFSREVIFRLFTFSHTSAARVSCLRRRLLPKLTNKFPVSDVLHRTRLARTHTCNRALVVRKLQSVHTSSAAQYMYTIGLDIE